MVAAVDSVPGSQSDAEMEAEYRKRIERILGLLKDVPHVRSEVLTCRLPMTGDCRPHDQQRIKVPPEALQDIRKGTPEHRTEPAVGFGCEATLGIPKDPDKIVITVSVLEPDRD